MTPIISSLLDLDLYKLTVHQIAFNRFGNIEAEYEFTCRNKDKVDLLKYVPEEELREQIFSFLPNLQLTPEEYNYLQGQGFYNETYLQYLLNFRFIPSKQIKIVRDTVFKTYRITAKGPWAAIILYETMILSIVNEIFEKNYSEHHQGAVKVDKIGFDNLEKKLELLIEYNLECKKKGVPVPQIIEFGTRRRYSRSWQEEVLNRLIVWVPENLVGTSNVHLARDRGIKAIGTFGHEFPMAMQGIVPVQHSQRYAFKTWLTEYRGQWGVALSDTLGDAKFSKDFSFELAKGYDGVRHDSGDPFAYGEKIIKMYEGYKINPSTKRIVFSDGLDFETMIALHKHFVGRIQISFGIGTNLTNDCGNPVLHIVMKIVRSNGQDVCKLSANPEKASCKNKLYLDYVKMAIRQY